MLNSEHFTKKASKRFPLFSLNQKTEYSGKATALPNLSLLALYLNEKQRQHLACFLDTENVKNLPPLELKKLHFKQKKHKLVHDLLVALLNNEIAITQFVYAIDTFLEKNKPLFFQKKYKKQYHALSEFSQYIKKTYISLVLKKKLPITQEKKISPNYSRHTAINQKTYLNLLVH